MFLLLMRYNSSQYRIPCTRIFSFSFNFFPISYFYLFFFLFACSFSFGQTTNIVIKRRERKKRTRIGKKEENRKSSFFFCVYAVNEESFVQKNPSSFLRARTKNLYICYKTYRIYTYTKFFFFFYVYLSRYACLILIWIITCIIVCIIKYCCEESCFSIFQIFQIKINR